MLLAFQDTRAQVDKKVDQHDYDIAMKAVNDKLDFIIEMHIDSEGNIKKHFR